MMKKQLNIFEKIIDKDEFVVINSFLIQSPRFNIASDD
jgi:hypothetical protein